MAVRLQAHRRPAILRRHAREALEFVVRGFCKKPAGRDCRGTTFGIGSPFPYPFRMWII